MENSSKKIVVIGAGFSGLAASAILAKEGHQVTLLEKNNQTGGRCSKFIKDGFTFDMGPSWYWMPDVFERYFNLFDKKVSDYYTLKRLSPSYKVFFNNNVEVEIPSDMEGIYELFEKFEKGSSTKLKKYLDSAEFIYNKSMNEFIFNPGISIFEFGKWNILTSVFKMNLFTPISKVISKNFKDSHLQQLLEFPSLFLGAKPSNTPGLYSLMNYADFVLGTWYPMGGMCKITEAMTNLAIEQGVKIQLDENVESFEYKNKIISTIHTSNNKYETHGVIATADYHHIEKDVLKENANYSEKYWNKKKLAPSAIIYYVGVSKKLKTLLHHNLFFDAGFSQHAAEIYDSPAWTGNPLFYVCAPSITDESVAPKDHENLFILIPVSTELEENDEIIKNYFDLVIDRIEKRIGEKFKNEILFKESFTRKDFISTYNSFKGNAYGLANTLRQTANLKPKIYNKKVANLFYAGQLTVPGPGVPPAIISGEISAKQLIKFLKKLT